MRKFLTLSRLLEKANTESAVGGMEFNHIDNFDLGSKRAIKAPGTEKQVNTEPTTWNPEKLQNGKWACNHKCKDKTA